MLFIEVSNGIKGPSALKIVLCPLDRGEIRTPTEQWTNITDDTDIIHHLLSLYFCWEYPTFASLAKEQFLQDFWEGRHQYCSSLLVNALLSLGCNFSQKTTVEANENVPYPSGNQFFEESQRLLNEQSNYHTLTTIQALGIMSIREASHGRATESCHYAGQSMRLAVEMGLHFIEEGDSDATIVRSATFWGAFALDQ